jgi:hypothetical protein
MSGEGSSIGLGIATLTCVFLSTGTVASVVLEFAMIAVGASVSKILVSVVAMALM